jgi:glycerol-3-phosphate acyltransferase PlsY
MLLPLFIAAVVGYLLGSLPFGYLVARAHGVDIFKTGSGNPGATNVKRVLGAKAGHTVYFLDALKGAVAAGWPWVWQAGKGPIFGAIIKDGQMRDLEAIEVALPWCIAGLVGAVLGHTFSIFTGFKGGKGVATASGGLLVLMPVPILLGAAVWLGAFFAWRYVSLASILSVITVAGSAWVLGLPPALKIVATLLSVLMIGRHQSNIRRLLAGTEHRWKRRPWEEGDKQDSP